MAGNPRLHPLWVPAALLICSALVFAGDPNLCDEPWEAPDVIVGGIEGLIRHGSLGDFTAFSIGTSSCNVGSCQLNWIGETSDHPVIGQNLFRLKDGRIEQIGQSWLKHGFLTLDLTLCSDDCIPSDGRHLGVNCSDPYGAGLNGIQDLLGPKFEVNASSGEFPYPATDLDQVGDLLYKRLQVHNDDLDPDLNEGARYFAEAQYVTADDALAGNASNNASYREMRVLGSNGNYTAVFNGVTRRTRAGIQAWKDTDASVTETIIDVPADGRFIVAARATPLEDGFWHYEYAVQNLNSHRSGGEFRVPIAPGTSLRDATFKGVRYHSGEPLDDAPWKWSYSAKRDFLVWKTESYGTNPMANALRWGTLYNFSFDAKAPPVSGTAVIGLFRPGAPRTVEISTVAPRLRPQEQLYFRRDLDRRE